MKDLDDQLIIFDGNTNSSTSHLNYFPENFQAYGLKIYPNLIGGSYGALQFELLGCYQGPCECPDRLS